ncbi:MAG: hypothetical protein A2Y15_04860 [Clostridiales bacterium GWF2_36_10]|nr:MAG: hypothetical protein A2Y15_04860 [Clostridiales bacterium GWF2_36_10]HAN20835.1 hypothetical protein [Clostridiales bacterium]
MRTINELRGKYKMLIKTKDFDFVNINEEDIITFSQGIYAYESTTKFIILNNPDNQWMKHLQSVEDEEPRFILLDPHMFIEGYSPIIPDGTLGLLKTNDIKDLSFFAIAVIPKSVKDITINLKSPVIINFKERIGAQVILENRDYFVRTRLFASEGTAQ